jgi:formyltetrahydrofolate deformylase
MKDTAVLLIDCPDRKGLVARVAGLLYEHGANILHADQHQDHDLGMFFMRVEWALSAGGSTDAARSTSGFDLVKFSRAFAPIAAELEMHWQIGVMNLPPRIALFCSQYLHCVADLLHRWQSRELKCDIRVIISNHREVEKLAAYYGIPFEHIEVSPATRAEAEAQQLRILENHRIELAVLARYMQILSPGFVARFPASIINVHHSFLPAFTGAKPYHAAHARGVKLIGATSHYVSEVLDDGPIIEQDVARISHRDQVEDLVARGRDLERMVLARAVRLHLDRRILCYGNKTVVFD